ncbi:hypothetical protein Tco_0511908 [Tanacetum coccineum]
MVLCRSFVLRLGHSYPVEGIASSIDCFCPKSEVGPNKSICKVTLFSHPHFSPSQEQATSHMPLDDLLQAVPKLISRIDSLEIDLKQTKLKQVEEKRKKEGKLRMQQGRIKMCLLKTESRIHLLLLKRASSVIVAKTSCRNTGETERFKGKRKSPMTEEILLQAECQASRKAKDFKS